MSKIFIETVGCPKNQEDSERMAGLLVAAGHRIVFDAAEADTIIVNTCGFIDAAKRESIETIFEYVPYKENGARLVVTGCLTQRYAGEIAGELPEADAILGVNDYERLPDIVAGLARQNRSADIDSVVTGGQTGILTMPRTALSSRHTSYLKIAEGCSNNCAYCAIPAIRGAYRSVPIEQLLEETALLAAEGCKELVLIAQDVTMYGIDLYKKLMLPELLRGICGLEGAKDIEWVRLLYCYEERVTDELIEVMASEPKILHYIDLPLQHVSDRILSRMRRASTGASIRGVIMRLREVMPDIAIRTTFITGLPGESDEEFAELVEFVEEIQFDRLGVFAYSPEDGTDAALMPDQVDAETAEARRDIIMRLQQQISLERNEALIGAALDVIADEREEGGTYVGRTRSDAPEIDCAVIFTDTRTGVEHDRIGEIVKVRITDAMDYDLVGELE